MSLVLVKRAPVGTTYYVAKTGNDANPGTLAEPFLTVNAGCAALAGGDTVLIGNGTYNEILDDVVPSGTSWSNPTTVRAINPLGVILSGTTGTFGVISVKGDNNINNLTANDHRFIVFDGLVLEGQNLDGVGSAAIHVSKGARSVRFQNGLVRNFRGDVNTVSAFSDEWDPITETEPLNYAVNMEIINSEFHGNLATDNLSTGGFSQVFYISGGSFRGVNNNIHDNRGIAFRVERNTDLPTIPTVITDNTFSGNWSIDAQMVTEGGLVANNTSNDSATTEWAVVRVLGDDVIVRDNTINNSGQVGILVGTSSPGPSGVQVLDNSVLGSSGNDIEIWGTGNTITGNTINKAIVDHEGGNTINNNTIV